MQDKIKEAFKSVPERFKYTITEAIHDAELGAYPNKNHISKGWKIAVAVILIAALIPTAVFGASKLYELIAKPIDDYGLEIDIERETKAVYPEYVKMHVEIPKGFAAYSPEPDNMKFYSVSASEKYTDGYSLYPMRFYNATKMKEYIGNVESTEERIVDGHQAYEVKMINGTWSRLYVYYEDVNVLLLIYHKDVTDSQLEDFVKGISFTEGTASDFTFLFDPVDERPQEQSGYAYDTTYVEYPLNTKLTFEDHPYKYDESVYYTAEISNVRTLDNITELDENCFNPSLSKYEISDDNGYLNPNTVNTIKDGDGFNSTDELLNTEIKDQTMVLADITYTNLSDEDIELYIPYRINIFDRNSDGSFKQANIVDLDNRIYTTDICDGEMAYISPHGAGKSFYILTLHAGETLTVTVGSRVNTDILDKAYFVLNGVSDVADPAPEGKGYQTVYLFKVTDNDR